MDLELGGMAASDSFLQPDRKIQDVNAVSAFNTMFIVLVSQEKASGNRVKSARPAQLSGLSSLWKDHE